MAGRPTKVAAGLAMAATCAGLLGVSGGVQAAQRHESAPVRANLPHRSGIVQIIAHPDDDLLFMSPDLARDIRTGGVTTVVLTAAEGHAGLGPDTHDPAVYVAERRQGLHAAYAAMAGVRDAWRVRTVRSGRTAIELHTLTGRPDVHLAFLGLPDGRDPRAGLGRRSLAQVYADRGSTRCAWTIAPAGYCYTHADVVRALVMLLRRFGATVVRAQDPAPDRRYTPDHTDHVAAARFAAEAVRASGRRIAQVGYRDYNLTDTPANLGTADHASKERFFAIYRAHDYRINPEATNYAAWQARMRYRWPRGASWVTRGPGGRLRAFAVLSGRLYVWWQTPSGWAGPAALGGGSLAPALAVAGGQVFALRNGRIVAAVPRFARGRWSARWVTVGRGVAGVPVAAAGRKGETAVFARDASGGVRVTCRPAGGPWPGTWHVLPSPARTVLLRAAPHLQSDHRTVGDHRHQSAHRTQSDRGTPGGHRLRNTRRPPRRVLSAGDVQDGMDAVGGATGIELFAPTRTQVLQWRQTGPCRFAYAGAVPGVRPGGPVTATRDAYGRPTLVYEEAETTAIRQVKEIGGTWTVPATPLRAVFHRTGEAPVPTGARVPPPALGVPVIGVPAVAIDGARRTYALALGSDGRLHVSARGPANVFGAWQAVG